MPKKSRKQINIDENRVIQELLKNSSYSIDKLAKICGFSRQKVWLIKKRLEKNKTIWGYHAIIDNEKLNVNRYIMLVKLRHLPIDNGIEKKMVDMTIDKLGADLGVAVKDSIWVHGKYDFIVSFFAQNLIKAKNFQENFMSMYNGNISELQLLENICTIEKDGFMNPRVVKTKKLLL